MSSSLVVSTRNLNLSIPSLFQSGIICVKKIQSSQILSTVDRRMAYDNVQDDSEEKNMESGDHNNESEDKALANWNKWLAVRREQHKNLGARLNRSPALLVMNSNEDARYLREEKEILERAQKVMIPDKYRGHPDFWRTPLCLPEKPGVQRCDLTTPKVERGLPVEPLERVGCPLAIKVEKDIVAKELRPTSKDKWTRSEYLATRKKELLEVADGDAFCPEMEELMVQGHAMKIHSTPEEKAKEETNPFIIIEMIGETQERHFFADRCFNEGCFCSTKCMPRMRVQSLTLQLKPQIGCDLACSLVENFFPRERRFNFRIIFNSIVNKKLEKHLRLENMSTVKIEFSWICNRNAMAPSRAVFFFNKNNDIILPGHIIHFPILFHSRSPGVFIEEWHLRTSPALLGDAEIIICFWGNADAHDYQQLDDMAAVESYLQRRLAQTAARENADESVNRATFSESRASRTDAISVFTEKDIFEERNPGFFYHPSVVENLKSLYTEIFGAESAEWDLSLKKFRQTIVESLEIEERQKRLEEFNNKVKKLLTAPRIQTLDLNAMKYDLGKGIFGHFPCTVEEQSHRLKGCFGIKEADSVEAPKAKDVEDETLHDVPEDTEAAATQDIEDELPSPEDLARTADYKDVLYKTLYQHLVTNMEQLAANIESIKMCNTVKK